MSTLLIDDSHHSIGSTKSYVVRSIAVDIIYNVSNGGFLTVKQCALVLEIHSMTGQKRPIVILSKLGHSISYEKVLEIETAQAEVVERFRSNSNVRPIQPVLESTKVAIFSVYWWKCIHGLFFILQFYADSNVLEVTFSSFFFDELL